MPFGLPVEPAAARKHHHARSQPKPCTAWSVGLPATLGVIQRTAALTVLLTRCEEKEDGAVNTAAQCQVAVAEDRELTPLWFCDKHMHRRQAVSYVCKGGADKQHPGARLLQHLSDTCCWQCVVDGLITACTEGGTRWFCIIVQEQDAVWLTADVNASA